MQFDTRTLLIIAAIAVAAYFLFFRNSSSSSTPQAETASAGSTTLQKGAVTVNVTDTGGADTDTDRDKVKQRGKPPRRKGRSKVHLRPPLRHPGEHESNPQPKPPARGGTTVTQGHHPPHRPRLTNPPVGTRKVP